MPLARVELPTGKAVDYRAPMDEAIQKAMHAALRAPLEERFQIFTEHAPGNNLIDWNDVEIDRSVDAIVVQVTLNEGRDADVKRCFHTTLTDGPRERAGLRLEDLVVVEMKRENWSFGRREAQLV